MSTHFMHRFVVLSASALALLTAGACGGYSSIIMQDGQGGVLSLHGTEDGSLEDAQIRMEAHCGGRGYRIVRREQVVIGQESYHSQQTDYQADDVEHTRSNREYRRSNTTTRGSQAGSTQTNAVSGVRDVTQTQITYECGR